MNTSLNTENIFQEALEQNYKALDSQLDEIKKNNWSEGDYIVLESAFALAAGKSLELKRNIEFCIKYLHVAMDCCRDGTGEPGFELMALMTMLKVSFDSTEEEMRDAMNKYLEEYPKL